MVVLLTNDDGINSHGLVASYRAMRGSGDIVVCAPESQKTGTGRGFTLYKPIRVREVEFESTTAHATSGTPVDSLLYAIRGLGICPSLVVSGINLGENLSTEITASGTVGVALESASCGYPTIAISLETMGDEEKFEQGRAVDFDAVSLVLRRIADKVLAHGLPSGVDILNVNVPSDATRDTPVEITFLERRLYESRIEKRTDPMGRAYYWNVGDIVKDARKGSDVACIKQRRNISITPLTVDMTANVPFETMTWLLD
ncbi:5'/3'-nucleotidase SurE [archaeon]|nr:MAG: 5'/3'-nucleotidase SurE [archaeon]